MTRQGPVRLLALATLAAGCAGLPFGTYLAPPGDPNTLRVANTLHRAAVAAGDDPARYIFALINARQPAPVTDEDATFYISDVLARMPAPVLQPMIAHEVLDHVGTRQRMTGGFSAAGFFVPGVGLLDFVVNPLVVRAFTRKQELEADRRAVEILRDMGDPPPRRSLAEALRAVDEAPVRSQEGESGALRRRAGSSRHGPALGQPAPLIPEPPSCLRANPPGPAAPP